MNNRAAKGIMIAASLGLDFMACRALWGDGIFGERGVFEFASFHAASIPATFFAFRSEFPHAVRASRASFAALTLGACLTLPLFGQALLACLAAVLKLPVGSSQNEKRFVIGENRALTEGAVLNPGSSQSTSVLEILHGMDETARRNAILALRHLDRQKALPVLQKAIQDSDEQVRLLAQTRYSKIVSSLELRIKRMERELEKSARPPHLLARLAEQYHELVYLGVSSPETAVIYLDRAIELLRDASGRAPDKLAYEQMLIRCLVKRGKLEEARQCIVRVRAKDCHKDFTMPWEAEIYFQAREWTALGALLKELDKTDYLSQRMKSLVEFWLRPGSPTP